jgi:CHAT domain-containing protein
VLLRLKETSPEAASFLRAAPLSAAEVRRLLAPDSTLVEFFVLDDDTVVAWIVERDSLEMMRLPPTSRRLHELVRDFREHLAAREPATGLSAALHTALLAPLLPLVHHPNLWLVPHGPLHLLPFAALADASGRPLAATHALAYLPSASVLPFVLAKRKRTGTSMLVLGDPDGSLPYAAAEARAVAGLYGVEPLLGPRATADALRERAPAANLVHIAAHVVFEPSRPLFSRIALAGDSTHDGGLEAHEVFGLDLRQTSLVVLSGCGSGLQQVSAGDDLVGLPRAFLYAGASSVIATLWSIDDEASAALMESFYRRLKQGDPPAHALREAQLAIRQDPRWQAPFYWAAFKLTGDLRGGS